MSNDPAPGLRGLLPEPTPTNSKGGTHSHRPTCRCNPCRARRRKAEALLGATGDGGEVLVPSEGIIHADEVIVASAIEGTPLNKRAIVAEWIKIRSLEPDISTNDAIKRLGIARSYFYRILNQASKEGWLRFDDPLARIEHQLIPKTLDNLSQLLDEGDRTTTLEVAKGTIFKSYQESKGLNQGSHTVLALKIELPNIQNDPAAQKVIEGQIMGRPKIEFSSAEEEKET